MRGQSPIAHSFGRVTTYSTESPSNSSGPKAPRETRLLPIVQISPRGSREHENQGLLIVAKKIIRVYWIADHGLIGQIGLEDYPSAGLERLLDLPHQGALQVIEIQDQIIMSRGQFDPFEIRLLPIDDQGFFFGSPPRHVQGNWRDIDRHHLKTALRQKDRVGSLSSGDVQCSTFWERPRVGFEYLFQKA